MKKKYQKKTIEIKKYPQKWKKSRLKIKKYQNIGIINIIKKSYHQIIK